MTASIEEWPPYHVGTRDHLHAIGVIIASWNQVEVCYQAFIQQIYPHNMKSAVRVFQILNNEQRVRLIRDELISSLPQNQADLVAHFLTMANICYANRNALAHATPHNIAEDDKLRISQGTGKNNIGKQYLFSLDALKEMADTTYDTFTFGISVFGMIQMSRAINDFLAQGKIPPSHFRIPSLPETPSLPRSWDQIREIPIPHQPPPRSSPA
jgi:hypothetical protein